MIVKKYLFDNEFWKLKNFLSILRLRKAINRKTTYKIGLCNFSERKLKFRYIKNIEKKPNEKKNFSKYDFDNKLNILVLYF